ncbi:MAG: hypothetical protein R2699_01215 [Acidimicrobiales bacterium]
MSTIDLPAETTGPDQDRPRAIASPRSAGDRRFRRITGASGSLSLVLMAVIAIFLLVNGWQALDVAGGSFFTTFEWKTKSEPTEFGVAAMLYGTAVVALIALATAVPIAVSAALFINEIAPRRFRGFLTGLVDLLAAIPSLIYGIWGLKYLQPQLFSTFDWVADWLGGFHPLSADQRLRWLVADVRAGRVADGDPDHHVGRARSSPRRRRTSARARWTLGATRWGMIRTVVLPFGRGGIIGGSMLGLGRALGETIAVALILSPSYKIVTQLLEPGGATVASTIAIEFPEATPFGVSALMAAGLALFLITLAVNMVASFVVSKSRSGKGWRSERRARRPSRLAGVRSAGGAAPADVPRRPGRSPEPGRRGGLRAADGDRTGVPAVPQPPPATLTSPPGVTVVGATVTVIPGRTAPRRGAGQRGATGHGHAGRGERGTATSGRAGTRGPSGSDVGGASGRHDVLLAGLGGRISPAVRVPSPCGGARRLVLAGDAVAVGVESVGIAQHHLDVDGAEVGAAGAARRDTGAGVVGVAPVLVDAGRGHAVGRRVVEVAAEVRR